MRTDDVVRTFSGTVAEEWDKKSKYIESIDGNDDQVPDIFSLLIKNGNENVLDVGCGTGKFAKKAAKRYPNIQIVGIDESRAMIDIAKKETANIRTNFYVADIADFQYHKVFDIIVLKQVLHHIKDKTRALSASKKMLSDRGKIIVMVPNPGHQQSIIPYRPHNDPLGRISESDMKLWAKKSNLQIEMENHTHVTATFANELSYFLYLRSIGSLQKIYDYKPVEDTLDYFLDTFTTVLSQSTKIRTTFGYSYYVLKARVA